MELIVINENKLKIMMSAPDMEKYGLNENEFHLSLSDTRGLLDRVIHNSPIKTGFEEISPDERILMQLYPEKDGGCELFVTRIPFFNEEDLSPVMQENEKRPLPRLKAAQARRPTITYSFKELNSVINVSRELLSRGFSGESSLHRDEDGKYYLQCRTQKNAGEDSASGSGSNALSCLSEFGSLENSDCIILHLLEHGKCIFEEDAVSALAEI